MLSSGIIVKIQGKRAILHSPATPRLLALLKEFEGQRSWVNSGKALSLESTPHNLELLASRLGAQVQREAAELALEPRLAAPPVVNYTSKTKPYTHQERAEALLDEATTFGLFMEQGTGKTKSILDWAGRLFCRRAITGMLVVSKKGVHRQWAESEAPKHLGILHVSEFWPINLPILEQVMGADWHALKIFTINYDALKTPRGLAAATKFATLHQDKMLMVADESQEIKNYRSARHKAMMVLRDYASHAALATGTPIARNLEDEWAQLKWLNESILRIRYVTSFRAQYCRMGGFENRQVIGHINIDKFKESTAPYVFRATKAEIGLSAKQFATWHYDLKAVQRDAITSIKRDLEAVLASGDIVTVVNAVSAMTKLQQVSSGFLIDSSSQVNRLMEVDDNSKIEGAMDWLAADEGAKAIIWFRFREEAEMLADAMAKRRIKFVAYHGGVNERTREAALTSFLAEEGGSDRVAQVFLANPQSAGTGLNLQGLCQRALYFSNSFNAIDRWQSEDRIHRIGTKGVVTYTDMVGKGTLDNYILSNLRKKRGLSDYILDDLKHILEELQ